MPRSQQTSLSLDLHHPTPRLPDEVESELASLAADLLLRLAANSAFEGDEGRRATESSTTMPIERSAPGTRPGVHDETTPTRGPATPRSPEEGIRR